jgi:hypothetical protein
VKIKTHISSSITFFFRKSRRLWDNVEKYGTEGDVTDGNVTQRMRIACWYRRLQTHTPSMQYLLLFYCNSGCTNAPQCYVIRTLSVCLSVRLSCVKFVWDFKLYTTLSTSKRSKHNSNNKIVVLTTYQPAVSCKTSPQYWLHIWYKVTFTQRSIWTSWQWPMRNCKLLPRWKRYLFSSGILYRAEWLVCSDVSGLPIGSYFQGPCSPSPSWTAWALKFCWVIFFFFLFLVALRPKAGHGLLILEVSRSHTTTHHSR